MYVSTLLAPYRILLFIGTLSKLTKLKTVKAKPLRTRYLRRSSNSSKSGSQRMSSSESDNSAVRLGTLENFRPVRQGFYKFNDEEELNNVLQQNDQYEQQHTPLQHKEEIHHHHYHQDSNRRSDNFIVKKLDFASEAISSRLGTRAAISYKD